MRGRTQTAQLLLSKGADVNARDAKARTAIMRAAVQKHTEVIRALRAHGAEVTASDGKRLGKLVTLIKQADARSVTEPPSTVAP